MWMMLLLSAVCLCLVIQLYFLILLLFYKFLLVTSNVSLLNNGEWQVL